MALNPRHVPWMTILGVIGLVIGYLIGVRLGTDPIVPAFWGLCAGTVVALGLRFYLTWRWGRKLAAEQSAQTGAEAAREDAERDASSGDSARTDPKAP